MLHYFKIEFYTGIPGKGPYAHVLAHGADDARILAQAERIAAGNRDTRIEHAWQVRDVAALAKVAPLAATGLPRIFDFDALA